MWPKQIVLQSFHINSKRTYLQVKYIFFGECFKFRRWTFKNGDALQLSGSFGGEWWSDIATKVDQKIVGIDLIQVYEARFKILIWKQKYIKSFTSKMCSTAL